MIEPHQCHQTPLLINCLHSVRHIPEWHVHVKAAPDPMDCQGHISWTCSVLQTFFSSSLWRMIFSDIWVVSFALKVSRALVSPGSRATSGSVYLHSKISFITFRDVQIYFSLSAAIISLSVCVCTVRVQTDTCMWVSVISPPAKDMPTVLIYDARPHSSDPNEKPIRCS